MAFHLPSFATLIEARARLARKAFGLINDRRGNVLVMSAVALPILLAMVGLAIEGGHWMQVKRSMQNAADAAVVSATSNGSASYIQEARAVAAKYGFKDGVDDTTVTVDNLAACPPSVSGSCISVTIQRPIPLIFSQVIGFKGNATVASKHAMLLGSVATAVQTTEPREYCVLALANSGTAVALRTNGAPKADLTGCNVMSNTSMTCNGHNLNATYGDAVDTNNGCGISQNSNMPKADDPYTSLATNIPSNPCSSYPQEPAKKKNPSLPGSNQLSGNYGWTSNKFFCGDVQLTGDVTLTGSDLVLIIENGQLDTNGYTLKTAPGAAVTIIFSGTSDSGYTHAPTGGGTLDIAAPTSGTWSGIAVYQDPDLTSGVDISAAGNSPTWDITGVVYLPNASVTFSGAVNKSSNGDSCFVLVIDNLLINGTGSILSRGGCDKAGVEMPTGGDAGRGQLVG